MDKYEYQEEINFKEFMTNQEEDQNYVLFAVLSHQGKYANSGHNFVYIRPDGIG